MAFPRVNSTMRAEIIAIVWTRDMVTDANVKKALKETHTIPMVAKVINYAKH